MRIFERRAKAISAASRFQKKRKPLPSKVKKLLSTFLSAFLIAFLYRRTFQFWLEAWISGSY